MITTRRVLLTTSNEAFIRELEKFEAIQRIEDSNDRSNIWALNKTPVMLTKEESCHVPNSVEVPFFDMSKKESREEFTEWCYIQSFEPGEYCTGLRIDTRVETCVLCSIIGHKAISRDTLIYNRETKKEDMIIYESPNFVVIPELGSIKPGFLMIVPKQHNFLSIAQLPSMYMREYMEVCEDVEMILKGAFGDKCVLEHKPVSFFEHGSGPSGFTSHAKSIVHAHVHVVIDFELDKKYLDMIQMKPCPDLSVAADTHYFAYKVGARGNRLCCYDDNVYVQRQYPRQIMAIEQGCAPGLYNWRTTPFTENIHTTLYYIWDFLIKKKDISYRIQDRTRCFKIPFGERLTSIVPD